MAKHEIWMFGVLVALSACRPDELQIGNDNARDGGGLADLGTGPVSSGGAVGTPGAGGSTSLPAKCGDGILDPDEQCDDGNILPADGCDGSCKIESGAVCSLPGKPCVPAAVCGNGTVEAGELCDCGTDRSRLPAGCPGVNGDLFGDGSGCTNACTHESICIDSAGRPGACLARCGDGIIGIDEECDDANQLSGDGCSASCRLEAGFTCSTVAGADTQTCSAGAGQCRSLCLPTCGDGVVVAGEECDVGARNNDGSYGGCATDCRLGPYCGDGVVSGPEECDLGSANGTPGAGCSSTCKLM